MKFRTDFVTNSSSSSFVLFHMENKPLLQRLQTMGIRFENVRLGDFCDGMTVRLPSGKWANISDAAIHYAPDMTTDTSLSAWLLAAMLNATGEDEEDGTPGFAEELSKLLSDTGLLDHMQKSQDDWFFVPVFKDIVDTFDADIAFAVVSTGTSFEGDVGPCFYTEARGGIRQSVVYCNEDPIEKESCKGIRFAATGKTKHYKSQAELFAAIEKLGGIVCTKVDSTVDYMICNDVRRRCKKMRSALELGIPLLTETGFIRRFGDVFDFDEIALDDDVALEARQLMHSGKVMDYVAEQGAMPITTQVWKNGKWTGK